ncbi:hypothetical protein PGT21_003875 [Puccinia graminis f. sp. tritici]|uniref:Uncharacterized protein n=1 Tax=Puccinia graminis f. sp. tritici TaxID=56615 RepID=A0A5B0MKC0_PUCGR|nr:hypothetical protein PGT21_003875 [Puccinia graminis f. sp. tritici]
MGHIKGKFGLNEEQLWIGNPNNDEEGMQIYNNRLTAWAQAIQHAKNPAIDLNHPPQTKEFKWIKHRVPTLDSLIGQTSPHNSCRSGSASNRSESSRAVGASCVVTPAPSKESKAELPSHMHIEEEFPLFPAKSELEVKVVWDVPNVGGTPADSPGGGTRGGSPARNTGSQVHPQPNRRCDGVRYEQAVFLAHKSERSSITTNLTPSENSHVCWPISVLGVTCWVRLLSPADVGVADSQPCC